MRRAVILVVLAAGALAAGDVANAESGGALPEALLVVSGFKFHGLQFNLRCVGYGTAGTCGALSPAPLRIAALFTSHVGGR